MKPVSPGESIFPNMTAQWFNSTLEKPVNKNGNKRTNNLIEGELRCYCLDEGVGRYQPLALVELADETTHNNRVPKVQSTGINKYNWVVTQENTKIGSNLCVVTGYTRAWVTKIEDEHKFVTYNSEQNRLETANEGKALLLKHYENHPSLISIETFISENSDSSKFAFFRTTQKIINRVVGGVVTRANGLESGASLTLYDPQNKFPDIEPDASGIAMNSGGKWIIITCTLPINHVVGTISEDLLKSNLTKDVLVQNSGDEFFRSNYPNIDIPPEFSMGNSGSTVEAENFYRLDAVKNSEVVIERKSNGRPSLPEGSPEEGPGSATTSSWVITQVEKNIARWVRFPKSSFEFVGTDVSGPSSLFWEGDPPQQAGINWLITNPGCISDGNMIIACYRPENHDYIPVSTQSALLGNPDDVSPITKLTSAGCRIDYEQQPTKGFKCKQPYVPGHVTIGTESTEFISNVVLDETGLCFNVKSVLTCTPAEDARTVCIPVVNCNTPPDCSGHAVFTWDEENTMWNLTTPCPEGCIHIAPPSPGNFPGQTIDIPCEDSMG